MRAVGGNKCELTAIDEFKREYWTDWRLISDTYLMMKTTKGEQVLIRNFRKHTEIRVSVGDFPIGYRVSCFYGLRCHSRSVFFQYCPRE